MRSSRPSAHRSTEYMADAVKQWQNGLVAIGARVDQELAPGLGPVPVSLMGSGWVVDSDLGLIATCAHVVIDCHPHPRVDKDGRAMPPEPLLDAKVHGVAIGVGIGESIRWWCRADLQYFSEPPPGFPPARTHKFARESDDEDRHDLAILKLCNWDGSPASAPLNGDSAPPWHWPDQPAIALPLGRSSALAEVSQLVMLGYGQGVAMGQQTSTTDAGVLRGRKESAGEGSWLATSLTIFSGHSGGPVLNDSGIPHLDRTHQPWALSDLLLTSLGP